MIIENKTSYNDAFWNFLNYQLRILFQNTTYNYDWIYPIEVPIDSVFKKRKTTDSTTINARVLFIEKEMQKEYLGKITLGNISQKAYVNTIGTDYTKCYPKSDISEWIKINEEKKEITIKLK